MNASREEDCCAWCYHEQAQEAGDFSVGMLLILGLLAYGIYLMV